MKHYKNTQGEVYAYETEAERQEFGSPELVEMTEKEVDEHLNPKPKLTPEKLKKQVTNKRWKLMTGGFTLPNGTLINTTIEDQNRISSVVANAHLAGLDDSSQVDFKAAKGWVQISIGELKNVVGLIGVFTQLLYSAEKEHHEIIDSLSTGEEITQYDISQGWPSNGAEVQQVTFDCQFNI